MSYALKKFTDDLIKHPFPQARSVAAPAMAPEYKLAAESEIDQLSTQQKLALLQMSRRISHQAIWRAMRQKFDAPPFTLGTFRQLRDLGLAELLDGQKYHSLTMEGARLCDLIGRQLVAEHHIHSPWLGGNSGANASLYCTCGWSASLRRGDHMQLKAARAFSTHLRTIEAMNGLTAALAPRKSHAPAS
jgi:hypothetical protein